jgi:hypothetical protein
LFCTLAASSAIPAILLYVRRVVLLAGQQYSLEPEISLIQKKYSELLHGKTAIAADLFVFLSHGFQPIQYT